MDRNRRSLVVGLVIALALVAAACSTGDSSDDTTTTSTNTTDSRVPLDVPEGASLRVGALGQSSFALVPFGTAEDEALAELSRFPGLPDRDSGWRILTWSTWTADGSEGVFSDDPGDPAAPNNSEYPEVRYQCWTSGEVETCAVFTGDGNGNRWLSGWDQSVGWDSPNPAEFGTTFSTEEGFWAGGPTQPVLANTGTELQGGEGGMLLFVNKNVFGRMQGTYPNGTDAVPEPGDLIYCLEAGVQPFSGFAYSCGVTFPLETSPQTG